MQMLRRSHYSFLFAFVFWCCHGHDNSNKAFGLATTTRFQNLPPAAFLSSLRRPSSSSKSSPSSLSLFPSSHDAAVGARHIDTKNKRARHFFIFKQTASSEEGEQENDVGATARKEKTAKLPPTSTSTTTSKALRSLRRFRKKVSIKFLRGWNVIKVQLVLLAIKMVLALRLERQVLTRLPSNVLLFLIRTCMKEKTRPRIIRILAVELDERLRDEVKKFTGKDEYAVGDLTKAAIRKYTGKETYELGDIGRATVRKYTGKDKYTFGDISRATEEHRKQWVKDYLGEEKAANYKFGMITQKAVSDYTGEEKYEFGQITKTTIQKLVKAQENYRFGSITKGVVGRATPKEVLGWKIEDISRLILLVVIGKEKYRFGDLSRGLLKQVRANEHAKDSSSQTYLDDVERELEMLKNMA